MAKIGRPKTAIDWGTLDKLCAIQCTQEEIAAITDTSVDTYDRACKREHKLSFAEYMKNKSAAGKMSLRRQQYQAAESGNVTMQIWLGKQYLGQSDKTQVESNITVNPLQELVKKLGGEAES